MEVKRRECWEIEETRYFLNLIRERQIMKCLDNRKFRADEIFKYLEKSMHEKGYKKNWKQMQTRFKTSKQMSELLDSRPIAIEKGIDSSVSQDSNNIENLCGLEDSILINERDDFNNHIYEDAPDPRDGAVPGCSQSNHSLSTTEIDNSSTDSSSLNNTHVKRQKYKSRSYETIVMKYADKVQEAYEKSQEKIMTQTKEYVSKLMESEKEMMDKILDNNRIVLKETTNQLLYGLQNIFGAATSTRTVNTSQMVPSIMPSFNEAIPPYLYPKDDLQHFQSPLTLPKVLINLKRPVNVDEEIQMVL